MKKNTLDDKENLNIVSEPSAYLVNNPILNFKFTIENLLSDRLNLVKTIRKGLNNTFFENVRTTLPFSETDWSDILNVSTKSMQRYKADTENVFKPIHSEKILEMAEVSALGLDVFDTQEQFYIWLKTPNFALGSMQPQELLKDSYGKEMVIEELHRIDNGIFV